MATRFVFRNFFDKIKLLEGCQCLEQLNIDTDKKKLIFLFKKIKSFVLKFRTPCVSPKKLSGHSLNIHKI